MSIFFCTCTSSFLGLEEMHPEWRRVAEIEFRVCGLTFSIIQVEFAASGGRTLEFATE